MNRALLTLALLAATAPLAAQSSGDLRAAAALRQTHIGGLTPLVTPAMSQRRLNGAHLGLRYALLNENNVRTNAFAVSALFAPSIESSVTITAGLRDADCNGCDASVLIGVGGDMRVYEGGDVASSTLTIAVSGDAGYAQLRPSDDYAFALAVGAPMTLSFPTGGINGLHVAPYFTPLFGVGQTSTPCIVVSCNKSGSRFILGGGVGVWNPSTNLSASLGVSRVMLSGAEPVFGVNVVIGGR